MQKVCPSIMLARESLGHRFGAATLQESTSSSGQDVALWPRQPKFDSWRGRYSLSNLPFTEKNCFTARTLCSSGLRGWTQVPLAQAAWAQIPQVSCFRAAGTDCGVASLSFLIVGPPGAAAAAVAAGASAAAGAAAAATAAVAASVGGSAAHGCAFFRSGRCNRKCRGDNKREEKIKREREHNR